MKITFELDGNSFEAISPTKIAFYGVTLTDALELFESVLLGAGYRFRGEIDIIDEEYKDKEEETNGNIRD